MGSAVDGEEQPIGRISILSDGDGDGVFDRYKVFLDGLVLPRSIAFYKNGILYGGHEKLWFIENRGDVAGERTIEVGAGNGKRFHPRRDLPRR